MADRGQGLLKTLRKVKPELKNDNQALQTAFTEVISSRMPEARGNGLKFVRQVISDNPFNLEFFTGSAKLSMTQGSAKLNIKNSDINYHGCISLVTF